MEHTLLAEPRVEIANLISLAEQKRLPFFQHMDIETLTWIAAHRPAFNCLEPLEDVLSPFASDRSPIDDRWFFEPRIRDGLHGKRHALRVAILANALALDWGLPTHLCKLAVAAALLHDVRRLHDKGDIGHGERAAAWVERERRRISCLETFSDAEIEFVAFAIRMHDLPSERIDFDCPFQKRLLADILKTADALDRYRLPRQAWWVDDSYINLQPDDGFRAFAFELMLASEQRFLAGESSVQAVLNGLNDVRSAYEIWK
jgi:hypothetical protein